MTIDELRLKGSNSDGPPGIGADADPTESFSIASNHGSASRRRWRALGLAGVAYLVLAVCLWWNVWSSHPTSVTTCGCGDASQYTWYLAWPAYALSHGLSLFHSTAMGFPQGVNLLSNTSDLAAGVVLAPVTWVFGPVATLNVALTVGPALSALAMFILLRRWVTWAPAAFAGGLFYGFSPFIVVNLSNAWLTLGVAVVPPLVVACLDELLIRQQRRPVVTGIGLGLLVTLQFFLGSEVLLMMAVCAAVGIAYIVAYAAIREGDVLRRHFHHAAVGLSAGAVTAVTLLAYPAWFALDGPAHLSGPIWGGFPFLGLHASLKSYVIPSPSDALEVAVRHLVGGYQGPFLSYQYFGIGVIVVVTAGTIYWRRDRRLWFFGAMTATAVILSLGSSKTHFLPWDFLANQPLFQNIWPSRFSIIGFLAVSVMLGLIVDHVYESIPRRAMRFDTSESKGRERKAVWVGAAGGILVAALALVPPWAYLAQDFPLTTQPVVLPTWFRTAAPHLRGHQILLIFPSGFADFPESALTWQAVNTMHYSMVGLGGPGAEINRIPVGTRAGASVVANVSSPLAPLPLITSEDIASVRRALKEWGVTMVVIPDQPNLPAYDQVHSVTVAAALVAAATGEQPHDQANAWVWTGVERVNPSQLATGASFAACTSRLAPRGRDGVMAATACVVKATDGRQ